ARRSRDARLARSGGPDTTSARNVLEGAREPRFQGRARARRTGPCPRRPGGAGHERAPSRRGGARACFRIASHRGAGGGRGSRTRHLGRSIVVRSETKGRAPVKPLRIGVACFSALGGSSIVASELGARLARRGHSVRFFGDAPPPRFDFGV